MFSASGDLSYNSSTGAFSFTESDRTASQIRGLIHLTGGDLRVIIIQLGLYPLQKEQMQKFVDLFQVITGTFI